MNKKTAVVYLRVSKKEQAKGYSLGDQLKACHKFAEENDLVVVGDRWVDEVTGLPVDRRHSNAIYGYCDPGESGTKRDRPALNAAIKYLDSFSYDYVIAQDTDRFSREPEVFYQIAHDMRQVNPDIGFGFVGGLAQGLNPDILLLSMALGMAKKEIDKTKRRSVMRKAEKARRGLFVEGAYVCPYGFQLDPAHPDSIGGLVINDQQAQVVRDMYNLYDDGYSLSRISEWLYERGIMTPRGRERWSPQVICRLLTSTCYRGVHVSNIDGEVIEKQCPTIVGDDLWERVNRSRAKARRRNHTRLDSNRRYLLGEGRLRCADCNGSYGAEFIPAGRRGHATDYLTYRHRRRPNDVYGFRGCRNDHLHSKYVEPVIWNEILAMLADPTRIRASYETYLEDIRQQNDDLVQLQSSYSRELTDIRYRIDNLIDGFEVGALTADELQDRRTRLDERIVHIREELKYLNAEEIAVIVYCPHSRGT